MEKILLKGNETLIQWMEKDQGKDNLDRFVPTLGSIQKQGNIKLLTKIFFPCFLNPFKMIQDNQCLESNVLIQIHSTQTQPLTIAS